MAILSWVISIASFLGGLAVQADLPVGNAHAIAVGLFAASVIACPPIWDNALAAALLDGKQRVMACVALLLALPLALL